MDQQSSDSSSPAAGGQPRPIETFALLTEAVPDLQERYEEYFAFYKPASPAERELLETAVHCSIKRRRVMATLEELANDQIRTAVFRYNIAEEDRVQHFKDLLRAQPGVAAMELARTALGCRFMIGRVERFLTLLHEEGTLYGNDRNEAINLCGARAETDREVLFESSGAYLVWLYALAAQPAPKDEHFVDLGNERYMPEELRDRQPDHWFGPPEVGRALLIELFEGMLAELREREQVLRVQFEEPARAGAEVRDQVLRGPDGMQLARLERMHQQEFDRAYQAFLRGRAESRKTGAVPGARVAGVHDGPAEQFVPIPTAAGAKAAGRQAAQQAALARQDASARVVPGAKNGIGARPFTGDALIAGVRMRAAAAPDPAPTAEPVDPT
jgi:hypothetical protein